MKRFKITTAILLCLVMLVSITACGPKADESADQNSDILNSTVSDDISGEDEYLDDSSEGAISVTSTITSTTGTASTIKNNSSEGTRKPEGIITDIKDKNTVKLPKYNTTNNKDVTVVIPWDQNQSWVKTWTAAYKALYGGKVTYIVVSDADMLQRLATLKATGKSPDCARIDVRMNWPQVITSNLAQDAGKLINLSDTVWSPVNNVQKTLLYNGKNYFITTEFNNFSGIIYNKKTMENNGLTEPSKLYYQDKWDWNKFLEYAQELTQDKNNDGLYETVGVYSDFWEGVLLSSGSDYVKINEAGCTPTLNDKNLLRAVNFVTSLGVSKYNVTEAMGFDEAQKMMRAGTLGMIVSINPSLYFPDMADAGTLGYAPVPRDPEADKYYHAFAAGGFSIMKGAKNPGAAAEYITAVRIASDNVASEVLLKGKIDENLNNYSANRIAFEKELNALVDDMRRNLYPVIPMFDRFAPDMYYYSLWGPAMFDAKPWSALAEEFTPLIQAASKK